MAIIAKCSTCPRIYVVLGQHSRTVKAVWVCPRCKRGRNLPR